MIHKKIGIIGGGASGFFLAANLNRDLQSQTVLLEQAKEPLQKVKISGGGRCNVTHACFDPNELVEFYPRGKKELRSVFHQFQPGDTMDWFEQRNVPLKIEEDNRIFPESDKSSSIIDILLSESKNIETRLSSGVKSIQKQEEKFEIQTKDETFLFDFLVICTGSSKKTWQLIENLGHKIISPVPSLFTFNCNDNRIQDLSGTSFKNAEVSIPNLKVEEFGDLLITHWGFSGPGVLKLSSRMAVELNRMNYKFSIRINFIQQSKEDALEELLNFQKTNPKQTLYKHKPFHSITKRFWHRLLENIKVNEGLNYANLSKKQMNAIVSDLCEAEFNIDGKSTFKDEFVTAGGIDLKEIDFKTMQSKLIPNLFFAGEVLNIDAVTGGFNFQACWSEAFIISKVLNQLIVE